MKKRILVVDDELSIREFFEILLSKEGYDVELAEDGQRAINLLSNNFFDLVISDIAMEEVDGIEVLKHAKKQNPEALVIMITAYASAETAIEAMKEGAFDYLAKPFKVEEIKITIEKALETAKLRRQNLRLKEAIDKKYAFGNLIGTSKKMQGVYQLIKQLSNSKVNVLIGGESGTGKELVAKAIHFNSPQKEHGFISLNCGAIPINLMESELFGHQRGSFTGAVENKKGLFELADGGTLFLDEIAEIPQSLQVKLLRVLQERNFRRVGGTEDIKVDVRIIAASNKNLEEEVARGNFRSDLFYRLNVVHFQLPALREREEDIPLLVAHFIKKYAKEFSKPTKGLSPKAREKLLKYNFPGNVRELENIIEGAVALENGEFLLLPNLMATSGLSGIEGKKEEFAIDENGIALEEIINRLEKGYLLKALELSDGKKQQAAKLLGMSFRSFRYRLQKHKIS